MNTTVRIDWDMPDEQQWLCPQNIEIALSAYCPNTRFEVTEVKAESQHPSSPEGLQGEEIKPFESITTAGDLPQSVEQDELWKEVGKIVIDGYDFSNQESVTTKLKQSYLMIKK